MVGWHRGGRQRRVIRDVLRRDGERSQVPRVEDVVDALGAAIRVAGRTRVSEMRIDEPGLVQQPVDLVVGLHVEVAADDRRRRQIRDQLSCFANCPALRRGRTGRVPAKVCRGETNTEVLDGDRGEQGDVTRILSVRRSIREHDRAHVFDIGSGASEDRATIRLSTLGFVADLPTRQARARGIDESMLDLLQADDIRWTRDDRIENRLRACAGFQQCRIGAWIVARTYVRIGEHVPGAEAHGYKCEREAVSIV